MRRLPALLFALLIVTSGCAEYLPWSEQSPEPETDSQADLNPPPGANTQWIFDAERLVSAHESALAGMNYRKEVRIRPNHSVGPSKWANSTLTVHAGEGRLLIDQRGEIPGRFGAGGSYKAFVANNTTTRNTPRQVGTQYVSASNQTGSLPENVKNNTQMSQILTNSDFTWNGTTTRNGIRLYRYQASTHTELPDVKSLTATVFVDERGFIHELSGSLQTSGSRAVSVDFSYRFSEVASPPTKPLWVNNVPTITVNSETKPGVIVIEHRSGTVIPAGTTIRFSLFNQSNHPFGDAELSKPLKPGDVAYLSIRGFEESGNGRLIADGEMAVNQPPANESAISLSNWTVFVDINTEKWSTSARGGSS
ncbi:hypothetical protein SAMN05421858_2570 [Haladaptatus litoreus]|uniref:Uncharacterized protein n=1 Tax=Haladaptatus litoreus TaxID=553468 RepID=A0A1N7BHW0_9EURY|nr:hypothetical protein [Haladaptatus litoreus]SIR50981.1 hypothetical protein SAMN05421858_2570 [Haladaptatus litoreus]